MLQFLSNQTDHPSYILFQFERFFLKILKATVVLLFILWECVFSLAVMVSELGYLSTAKFRSIILIFPKWFKIILKRNMATLLSRLFSQSNVMRIVFWAKEASCEFWLGTSFIVGLDKYYPFSLSNWGKFLAQIYWIIECKSNIR